MIPINGNFKSLYAHPGMPTEKEIKQSTHDLLLDKKKNTQKQKTETHTLNLSLNSGKLWVAIIFKHN